MNIKVEDKIFWSGYNMKCLSKELLKIMSGNENV